MKGGYVNATRNWQNTTVNDVDAINFKEEYICLLGFHNKESEKIQN